VAKLPRERAGQRLSMEERSALEASTLLGLANLDDLVAVSAEGMREHLDQTMSRLYYLLGTLSDAVTAAYFQHGQPPQPLSALKPT